MKILLIGPLPPPITGTSVANQIIMEHPALHSWDIRLDSINTNSLLLNRDIGKFSWRKIVFYTGKFREAFKIFSHDKVYITIGLTFWGVLKYAPYILLSRVLKKEVIIHVHSDYLWQQYRKLSGLFRWIFKTILSNANKGIVLSPLLKRNLQPFLDDKDIYVIPNCVDDYLLQFDLDQKFKTKFDKLRILYLSSLMKEKGIFDLLEALRILKESRIPFEAYLAGSLEYGLAPAIRKKIEKLAPEISYFDVVDREEKKLLLMNSNVFVLPTYYSMEGQPISILEAMATGNVILTTEHAGIPDIFQDNVNGYYVEKQNPLSILEKLICVHNNLEEQKRIATNNSLCAQQKYKMENFTFEIKQVFEK